MERNKSFDRRILLQGSLSAIAILAAESFPLLSGLAHAQGIDMARSLDNLGPLLAQDAQGARLPQGYQLKALAESGSRVKLKSGSLSRYTWHYDPDGGACFGLADGGWIYVSNAESDGSKGGAGALLFDRYGQILDAYPILQGTTRNCAGGATPWNTWLSCEEVNLGRVFECDPTGSKPAEYRPALGLFKHEAAAVDPVAGHIYLTEDEKDGCLYRYTPATISAKGQMDLSTGQLEVACREAQGGLYWLPIPNPTPQSNQTATRKQVKQALRFNGGEGIYFYRDAIYFSTKGDNRVWRYQTTAQTLDIIYDINTSSTPILSGVDNLTVSAQGHILVAEDGGDLQIVILDEAGRAKPLLQLLGHNSSELTGPAFSPKQDRLYFSSQRGRGFFGKGITYELLGPMA